jgi:hypothetical protein
MRLFQTVEGIGSSRIFGFVRMDEERLFAVCFYDVRIGNTGLEVENIVGVEAEGFENS